jgi:hypothetical protein
VRCLLIVVALSVGAPGLLFAEEAEVAVQLLTYAFACPVPPHIEDANEISTHSVNRFVGDKEYFVLESDNESNTQKYGHHVSHYELRAKYPDLIVKTFTGAPCMAQICITLGCRNDRKCITLRYIIGPSEGGRIYQEGSSGVEERDFMGYEVCDRKTAGAIERAMATLGSMSERE